MKVLCLSGEISDIIERKILEIIKKAGKEGILQREIWHKIDLDSRRGHKILRRLEAQGYIVREPVIHKGRKTYIVRPAARLFIKFRLPPELDDVPCFYCEFLPQCYEGYRNPLECEKLKNWLEAPFTAQLKVELGAKIRHGSEN
ncbi:MAG: transcription factor TFIIIC [Thermoprotei archaeon]|nr:MAG: transcription factor TFIIIC [Thermoprotei archaeon]